MLVQHAQRLGGVAAKLQIRPEAVAVKEADGLAAKRKNLSSASSPN